MRVRYPRASNLAWFYHTEFFAAGYDGAEERAFQPGQGIDYLQWLAATRHFGPVAVTVGQAGRRWYYLEPSAPTK
jgi:hypothetical protein